jgi:hypothetical protein
MPFICGPAFGPISFMPLMSFMAGAVLLDFADGEVAGTMPGIDSMSFLLGAVTEAAGVGAGVGD